MTSTRETHAALVYTVAKGLDDLLGKFTFLGGATIGFYLTDPVAPSPRATDDVDCIIELQSRPAFWAHEEKLRERGFVNSTNEGDPVCRWIFAGVSVDVVPADSKVLGFANRWYRRAIETRTRYRLKELEIYIPRPEYLVATKLEAFEDRGKNDFAASHELEDIISLIDGRAELQQELLGADDELRQSLQRDFRGIVTSARFLDVAEGLLPAGPDNATRTARAIAIMKQVAGLSPKN